MPVKFDGCSPNLSEQDVQEVQRRLGIALPTDLRAFYLSHNGGTPDLKGILGPEGLELVIEDFLPMKHRTSVAESLFEETYENLVLKKELIPSALIPFAVDGGGDYFCMNLVTQEIVYYAMEHCDEPDVATTVIAGSLADLLENLRSPEELFGYSTGE